LRKRHFSHLREKFCEKIDAASQAGSYDQVKRLMRKTSAFVFLFDGDKAAKTPQNILEKFCEKNAHLLYRLDKPHKPLSSDAEKSFKRKNHHLF